MFSVCRSLICCAILLAAAPAADARTIPRAYSGNRLAYVSGGKLYVGFPKARLVPGPGSAAMPSFSRDGEWLAFMRHTVNPQLWVARADGSGAHRIPLMLGVAAFAWSPSADMLAVQPIVAKGQTPIVLVSPRGTAHTISHHLSGPFLWSPDGQTLAVADMSPTGYTRLDLVHGNTVKSYSLPGASRHNPVGLYGWWPGGHGILYWLDPGACESCIADGTKLLDYDLLSRRVHYLGISLTYRDWIAVSRRGLLFVSGGPRPAFFGKHVRLCLSTGPCKTLPPRQPNQISLDPAEDPAGDAIAFVVAPAWHTWGFRSDVRYQRWMNAHVLWTANPDGSGARPASIGMPMGAEDPEWTRDGRGLLFMKDGALWLDPHLGAANAHPIARLVSAGAVPNYQSRYLGWYYGHMDWHDLFAWY